MDTQRKMLNAVYFGSGAKGDQLRMLSNFAACEILVDPASIPVEAPGVPACWAGLTTPLRFPSTEHVWQAFRARNQATFLRFTVDGDLGRWAPTVFAKGPDPEAAAKKMNFCRKQHMIGIIAKMASNETHAKKLGARRVSHALRPSEPFRRA